MLTLTAVMVGLMLVQWLKLILKHRVLARSDALPVVVSAVLLVTVAYQFYFVMLPLAWRHP